MPELEPPTLIVRNIGELVTLSTAVAGGPLGIVRDAIIAARGATILFAGPAAEFAQISFASSDTPALEVDAAGQLVTPGLIDAHTHVVFAGSRAAEFQERHAGVPPATILERGGGINATVRATRAASVAELARVSRARLTRMRSHGTTTVEAKSGYGLEYASEDRQIAIAELLDMEPDMPRIVPTFLGAHALPPEYRDRRDAYVRMVCADWIPRFAGRARFCDVYCEQGYFTPEETRTILATARSHGYALKLHANQLGHSGGAAIAAELGAVSADHLDFVTDGDLDRIAASGVVAVLLPGCSFAADLPYPRIQRFLDHGVRVALATNCNPGTSYCENLQLIVALAIAHMGMTIDQALLAVTRHGASALALDDVGEIAPGKRCDLALWNVADHREIGYHFGVNLVDRVIIGGHLITD